MTEKATLGRFPQRVPAGRGEWWQTLPGWWAEHDRPAGKPAPGAAFVLQEGRIAVFRGPRRAGAGPLTPVYARGSQGAPAVPTGRVFVRFAEQIDARAYADPLAAAGYEIVTVPDWAPHTAWLRARSHVVADALAGMDALARVPGVEHVEPEMLTRRRGA
jgi:hypothetical protein